MYLIKGISCFPVPDNASGKAGRVYLNFIERGRMPKLAAQLLVPTQKTALHALSASMMEHRFDSSTRRRREHLGKETDGHAIACGQMLESCGAWGC